MRRGILSDVCRVKFKYILVLRTSYAGVLSLFNDTLFMFCVGSYCMSGCLTGYDLSVLQDIFRAGAGAMRCRKHVSAKVLKRSSTFFWNSRHQTQNISQGDYRHPCMSRPVVSCLGKGSHFPETSRVYNRPGDETSRLQRMKDIFGSITTEIYHKFQIYTWFLSYSCICISKPWRNWETDFSGRMLYSEISRNRHGSNVWGHNISKSGSNNQKWQSLSH